MLGCVTGLCWKVGRRTGQHRSPNLQKGVSAILLSVNITFALQNVSSFSCMLQLVVPRLIIKRSWNDSDLWVAGRIGCVSTGWLNGVATVFMSQSMSCMLTFDNVHHWWIIYNFWAMVDSEHLSILSAVKLPRPLPPKLALGSAQDSTCRFLGHLGQFLWPNPQPEDRPVSQSQFAKRRECDPLECQHHICLARCQFLQLYAAACGSKTHNPSLNESNKSDRAETPWMQHGRYNFARKIRLDAFHQSCRFDIFFATTRVFDDRRWNPMNCMVCDRENWIVRKFLV